MILSVVIPTRDRPRSLARCLEALSRERGLGKRFEVIVVDDGSRSVAGAKNAALCAEIGFSYESLGRPRGPAHARNRGATRGGGEWICFVDDDVCVEQGYIETLCARIGQAGREVVGIEGRTVPRGNGLWDGEVANLSGGRYLTSNIAYRRAAFLAAGAFNEAFTGPFGEDHELAVRMLAKGRILFAPNVSVHHLPRNMTARRALTRAPRRMWQLLRAEQTFYLLQPDDYARFRHADSFRHTYRAILMRHAYTCVRRRSWTQIREHPRQAAILILAGAIEQLCAWMYLPPLCMNPRRSRRKTLRSGKGTP